MRARVIALGLLIVTFTAGLVARMAPSPGHAAPGPALVQAVEGVGITVADLDRAIGFYTRVLAFEKLTEVEVSGAAYDRLQGVFAARLRVARLRLGDEVLELTEYLTPRGRPIPIDSRSHDRWFQHVAIIVSDIDAAYRRLRREKVELVTPEPQRLPDWNPNAGGIRALYFKDPDGHPLEILQFPPDKGARKWHRPSDRLFLGIDHTAVVVGDTDVSLGFYRDTLGLSVVGESENWGPEQERLNHVYGARLRITTLRASDGPAIEFLEYLTPRDGRSPPPDTRANDLVHWQTLLRVDDGAGAARRLRAGRATFVSPAVVALPDRTLGFREGFLVRDPDGHALQVRGR